MEIEPEGKDFWSFKVNPGYILSFVVAVSLVGVVKMYGEFEALKEVVLTLKTDMQEIKHELRGK